jgi:hypothetical protein
MSAAKPNEPAQPPVKLDFLAALLSYLIPGLGQMTQGRVAKGLLFLFSLYALFFYGMVLGSFKNVYLPDNHRENPSTMSRLWNDVYTRFQFVGQFPIGIAAWPAVYQYVKYDPTDVEDNKENEGEKKEGKKKAPLGGFMRAPDTDTINDLQRSGDKTYDLGWVYTVIAGVLNVLVIYDALAGPAFREVKAQPPKAATP